MLLTPPLIQKRFISDISHVETETLNLILDPPNGRKRIPLDHLVYQVRGTCENRRGAAVWGVGVMRWNPRTRGTRLAAGATRQRATFSSVGSR